MGDWSGLGRSLFGVAMLTGVGAADARSLDMSTLPQSCKDTLAAMQGEKAQFSQIGKQMVGYRKARDTGNFCQAARTIVTMIKAQDSRLDGCVGELASAAVPQATTNEMLALKASYKQMLAAAKDPKYDNMHCGLADQ